jgi:hypothetical protein
MKTKKTSKEVAAIAGRVLDGDALTPEIQAGIALAIRTCGLPLNDRAILVVTTNIEAALAPLIDDMQSLAGSIVSVRPPKSKDGEGFSAPNVPGEHDD